MKMAAVSGGNEIEKRRFKALPIYGWYLKRDNLWTQDNFASLTLSYRLLKSRGR